MEQAAVTVEFGNNEHRDLAVPITVGSQVLAGALARALRQPDGAYMLAQRTLEGLRHLPRNATLADMGVLCGARLVLQAAEQTQTPEETSLAYLVLDSGQRLLLERPTVIVGRKDPKTGSNPDIDLGQIDLRKYTSRSHAKITGEGDGFKVEDLGSANGTFVNGRRLALHVPQALQNGDVIEFGRAEKGGVRVTFFAGK